MIVDDDPQLLRALTRGHATLAVRVISAPTGRLALAMLAADSIDVMVCDLELPDMSGIDLTARALAFCADFA